MTDIPALIERLRAWKSLRACDFEENSPLAEDLEAAAQAFQQQARENRALRTESDDRAGQMEQLRARICELEAEIIQLAEPPNPPLTMNDALALLNAQAREIERLKNEVLAPLPPCMMPDGGECCPQYHAAVIRIDKLRETLADMTGAAQG